MEHIKLFIGCSSNGEDAESLMVAEYTARLFSTMPIDITFMKDTNDPQSPWGGWNKRDWATPFSGYRWAIPEVTGFKGKAIYTDSDMIFLHDLAELWNTPFEDGKVVQAKGGWRFCVCMWDCERVEPFMMPLNRMKSIPESHNRMFNFFSNHQNLVQQFDRQWNNFDGENDDLRDIKILHYTDMSTQPHLKYAIPRLQHKGMKHWYDGSFREHRRKDVLELFDRFYNEAHEDGYKVEDYIPPENEMVENYNKQSQKGYEASNGFDVTKGE